MAEEDRIWSRDAEELAACFTVHARDLFGYACVLTGADQTLADDLVQAAFEAAAAVWCTLRNLTAGQRYDWLRDTLAAAIQHRAGHPADRAFISPAQQRPTQLKMTQFRGDYDAVTGLDRFAGWLRTQGKTPHITVFTRTGYPRMGGLAVRSEPAQPPRRGVTVTR